VSFPSGATLHFGPLAPHQPQALQLPVHLESAVGRVVLPLHLTFGDASQGTTQAVDFTPWANANVSPADSATETFEEPSPPWTAGIGSSAGSAGEQPWIVLARTAADHVAFGPDSPFPNDQVFVSPPLQVSASAPFGFTFRARYGMEVDGNDGTFYDGAVLELSNDDGASWTDLGNALNPGYGGTLTAGNGAGASSNPLAGRRAFVGRNPSYPGFDTETVSLGSAYAGQTVRIRFRVGTDDAATDDGIQIDDLAFTGITNTPFRSLVDDPGTCVVASSTSSSSGSVGTDSGSSGSSASSGSSSSSSSSSSAASSGSSGAGSTTGTSGSSGAGATASGATGGSSAGSSGTSTGGAGSSVGGNGGTIGHAFTTGSSGSSGGTGGDAGGGCGCGAASGLDLLGGLGALFAAFGRRRRRAISG
jgi:hypothetical protein